MPLNFQISREQNRYFATPSGGERFFVGRRTTYEGLVGLVNIFGGSPAPRIDYKPSNYTNEFGFWTEFIDPTAECEGRSFMTLNSYDTAAFTFGFGQFAAHVPNGDFVTYFRALLQRPEAPDYFPDLQVRQGSIHRVAGGNVTRLETAASTQGLRDYLNPSSAGIEVAEVLAAARLIHWTANHRPARLVQINVMIDTYRGFMRTAAARNLIEGRTADQCCVIADILHHGRGGRGTTWQKITAAVQSANPFESLVAIGDSKWDGRKAKLKATILANPSLKSKRWSGAAADFV
jgi:hypothetical protein